jgi:diguanylate cyclase (GGDEF)-like protein
MKFLADLEKRNRPLQLFLGLVLILAIGVIDFVTGYELAFSLFYVLPIALITWLTDRRFGLAASVISAIVWLVADLASQHVYSNPLIPIWNTLIRLAFFVIITLLLSALRMALQRESELARVDYLTGALNSRYFYDLAQREIDLFQRYQHPFTLAYLDLDNFKAVNDQLGHATGDQVLRKVVSSVKANLRKTDMVARMGGDEFVMLLPETNQKSAEVVLSRLQLHLLEEMHNNDWPITFSTGVLTCTAAPDSPDELVMLADDLMYAAKHDGKNTFKFMTYSG